MTTRPILFSAPMIRAILEGRKSQTRRICDPRKMTLAKWVAGPCPYGVAGDLLWVRETWAPTFLGCAVPYLYRADYVNDVHLPEIGGKDNRWRPSIHMPRAASRLTLRIVSTRVERLQGISERDAVAEGVIVSDTAIRSYSRLWDHINGDRASWASNPWVWVVEFEVVCA